MNRFFKFKENHTTAATEVRAGFTTFFAMAYIIFLNPVFLSATGMSSDGVLIATCISSAIGTLICALVSNKPFALAPGMGINAFFAYTLCGAYGYTWQQALALTLISGVCFLIVVCLLKQRVSELIPTALKHAITIGIGLFIAEIGLLNSGIISMETGLPSLGNIKSPAVAIALLGLVVTLILSVLKVRGSLIIGILLTAIASLITGQTSLPSTFVGMPFAIRDVAFHLDFAGLLPGDFTFSALFSLITIIISMTIVDMFDTLGFLIGTASKANMVDQNGKITGLEKVMTADAAATIVGALFGTSTVTAYAESASGIEEGGKTGLTGVIVAIGFLLATFLSPLTSIMNSSVTSPALIVVGMYIMMDIRKLELANLDDAIPVLLTIISIPLTYSITSGIGIGYIAYVICKIAAGKVKEFNLTTIVIAGLFLLHFILG